VRKTLSNTPGVATTTDAENLLSCYPCGKCHREESSFTDQTE